jgi:hypothetical protein
VRICFGIAYGDEDVVSILVEIFAVIIGLIVLCFAWVNRPSRSATADQHQSQDSGWKRAAGLALLGALVMIGGILYGQLRMHETNEKRRKDYEEGLEKQRKESGRQ